MLVFKRPCCYATDINRKAFAFGNDNAEIQNKISRIRAWHWQIIAIWKLFVVEDESCHSDSV